MSLRSAARSPSPAGGPSRSLRRRVALVVVTILGTLSTVGLCSLASAGAASAQTVSEGGDPATAPCFAGAPPRTGVPGDGPSPVGRCEPTGGQKLVDNLVWVWLVALLGVGGLLAVRWLVGGGSGGGTDPDDPGR